MAGLADGDEGDLEPTLLQRLLTGVTPQQNIDADLSTWTLIDGQLVVTLIKRKAIRWTDLYAM